jgi:hypothetical protein
VIEGKIRASDIFTVVQVPIFRIKEEFGKHPLSELARQLMASIGFRIGLLLRHRANESRETEAKKS